MFKKRNFVRDDAGAIGIIAMILIGAVILLGMGGLFFIWMLSMLPEIGLGILYIAIAIALVIAVSNVSKAILNKATSKVKARRTG